MRIWLNHVESAGLAQLSKRLRTELKDDLHMSTLPMVSASFSTAIQLKNLKIAGPSAALFQKALVRFQVELYQTKKINKNVCHVPAEGHLFLTQRVFQPGETKVWLHENRNVLPHMDRI